MIGLKDNHHPAETDTVTLLSLSDMYLTIIRGFMPHKNWIHALSIRSDSEECFSEGRVRL